MAHTKLGTKALLAALVATTALCDAAPSFAQTIDEIIVTTRRRAENLQEIPLAITAFSADVMERKGLSDLDDILKLTAGMTLDTFSAQNTRVVVRGLSPTRGRPNVAFLQDGVDISSEAVQSTGGSLLNNARLFDLERVEIVKGPQSALYGRSAFAGAINYITKKPGDKFEGKVMANVGDYGLAEVAGTVSGPVVADKLSMGATGSYWRHNGFYRNTLTNKKIGGNEGFALAGSFVGTPNDTIKLTGRLEYTNDDNEISPFAYSPANATLPVPSAALGRVISPAVPTVTAYVGKTPKGKTLRATISPDPVTGADYPGSTREIFRATLTAEADLDFATLTSQTHYTSADTSQLEENARQKNLNQQTFSTLIGYSTDTSMFSQEVRLASPDEQALRWIVGGLYWKEKVDQLDKGFACLTIPTSPCGPLIRALPAFPGLNWARDTTHYSGYGLVSYDLTEQLTLSAEARLHSEDLFVSGPISALTLDPFGTIGRPVASFGPVANRDAGDHDAFVTPRFSLEFKAIDDVLLYASVSKGAKPSGVSTVGAATGGFEPDLFRFERESMWVYEIGEKGTFLDGKAQLNTTGYYQDFSNKQVTTQIVRSNGLLGTRTVNAGGARVYGLEVEAGIVPTEGLNLGLAYAYTDAKYTDFITTASGAGTLATIGNCTVVTIPTVPTPTTTCQVDRSGNELEDVARHSLVMSAGYTAPLSGDLRWRIDTDVKYQDDRFDEADNALIMPGYWMVDLRVGIETDAWDVTAYANNLFNDDTVKTAFAFTDFTTIRVVAFPPPFTFVLNNALQSAMPDKRQLGIRARYRF